MSLKEDEKEALPPLLLGRRAIRSHKQFGTGIVQSVKPSSEGASLNLEINFEEGPKTLRDDLAQLRRVG